MVMAFEVVLKIKEAEKEAEDRICKAEDAAKTILQESRAVASEKAKEIEESAAAQADIVRFEAEKKADEYKQRRCV